MKLSLLQKVHKTLNRTFHTEEFLDNALAVSFGSDMMPFALIIMEEDDPDTIFLSVAVNSPDPYSVADVALRLIHLAKTELSEPFYIDPEGELSWGQDAYETYQSANALGVTQDFLDAEPVSKLVN